MTNQNARTEPLETPPNVRRAPLEVVRAFQFNQDDTWLESQWPRFWMVRLRQVFDEKCRNLEHNLSLRGELLRVLNLSAQVIYEKTVYVINIRT